MHYHPLPRSFFSRHPRIVARQLLGKLLVRRADRGHLLVGRIVETEAYLGAKDLAAHASAGLTARNAVLFGPPGHAYVYFTYGMYYCMNISCEREGKAGCVLLRALEPIEGLEEMAENRGLPEDKQMAAKKKLLTSGPGRLCMALDITRTDDNGKDVCSAASDLYAADDGLKRGRVMTTPRIGISKSAELPLRFFLAGNVYVSGK
jgi:DNA-3-methyladenine glycosylase